DRGGAEYIFEAARGDVQRRRVTDHEWYAVAFGNWRRGKGARGLVGAHQRIDLVLGNQSRRQLLGERGVALMVDEHDFELGAAEMRQAGSRGKRQIGELRMRIVDDVGGGLDRRF